MSIEVDAFGTATIALCVFFLGSAIVQRLEPLRTFGIPESVVGGLVAAVIITIIYYAADLKITFDVDRRDFLLAYFFSALGLRPKIGEIVANGRSLFVLILLASFFIVLQNGAGMAIASAFGHDPKLGIVTGSMALIGRSGTTVAWAPLFEQQFALQGVSRLGFAANMLGLIAACCIGGPIARFLIGRHRLTVPGQSADLSVGISRDVASPQLDYRAFLLAVLRIHIAIIIGQGLNLGFAAAGIEMPLYAWCLVAALVLGNTMPRMMRAVDWTPSDQCLSLIAYVSLGLFYTMTIMSLELWNTQGMLVFLLVTIALQALLTAVYAGVLVFRVMGRDYEAAVISSGFAGISMGSTATTMAIIAAVAKQYGRAPRALVIVPLACGIFIDIINSLIIAAFAAL